ncbi:MAG: lipoprotein [Firmicutes bacterium]|nr:lipoprotein [Bacillota bacterium]
MKKISFIIASLVVLLTACQFTTSKSYTFDVDTGDQIEVSLDTTGGFDLSSTVPLLFRKMEIL